MQTDAQVCTQQYRKEWMAASAVPKEASQNIKKADRRSRPQHSRIEAVRRQKGRGVEEEVWKRKGSGREASHH
jgi:hypothetical protein